jgi:hypothetical protein
MDAKTGAIDEQRHQNYATNSGSSYQSSREKAAQKNKNKRHCPSKQSV